MFLSNVSSSLVQLVQLVQLDLTPETETML